MALKFKIPPSWQQPTPPTPGYSENGQRGGAEAELNNSNASLKLASLKEHNVSQKIIDKDEAKPHLRLCSS